jgi:hypothetical protein
LDAKKVDIAITDGGSENSPAIQKLWGKDGVLWIWCSCHLLSLTFEDSCKQFPYSVGGEGIVFVEQARSVAAFMLSHWSKIGDLLVADVFTSIGEKVEENFSDITNS